MEFQDIKIILSQPQEAGNIGAVCRAMANFGLEELRIAAPLLDFSSSINIEEIRKRAVNSEKIVGGMRVFDTLSEAVKDCSLVVGTTRRRGYFRKKSMAARDLACWLAKKKEKNGSVAIVFGNERTGLTDEEINLCNCASHIPVDETQPSLNLSHAVQIYAYELWLALQKQKSVKGDWHPMGQSELNELVKNMTDNLEQIGFYSKPAAKEYGRTEQERFFRDIFARAGLSESEGTYLGKISDKIAGIKMNSVVPRMSQKTHS